MKNINPALFSNIPRALRSMPRAETDTKGMLTSLTTAFEEFKAKHNSRLSGVESSIDSMADRSAGLWLNGSGGSNLLPVDPEYTTAFASYFRQGSGEEAIRAANGVGERAKIQAAMSEGSNADGGYLAPVEWDRKINQALVAISPMRTIATVQTTSVMAYSTLWNNNGWGSGWVGETAARPNTTSSTLSPIVFGHGEIYANVAATQRLLDDAAMDLEQWIAGQVDTEFAKQEGIAFISGDGVNKPFGLLQYITGGAAVAQHPGGNLDVVPSTSATTILPDPLIDFFYGLASPYRQNATWLMNSQTAAIISKLKDGQGNYLWREGLMLGQPATLIGRPVVIDEGMPAIGAGNLPIAFGDFKAGYLINDRIGTRVLRDPYTNKPFVNFYATKRVGAGVMDPRAIRLMKISVS